MRLIVLFLITHFVSALCGTTTVCAQAPALDNPPAHRWHVGTQVSQHNFAVIFPGIAGVASRVPGTGSVRPYTITVGYYLTPRLAIQASGIYGRRQIERMEYGTTDAGAPTTYFVMHKNWGSALPVTLRYTLTKQPAKRLQFDGVVGVSFASVRYRSRRTSTEDGIVISDVDIAQRVTGTYLTGGISARLGLGKSRRVQIVGDFLANRDTENLGKDVYRYLDIPGGLTHAYGLGLRYRFW